MVPEFVDRMRGSNRLSALPTGSKWQSALPTGSKWLSALPTEEPSRSNLWRLGSCAVRRQQVRAGSACPVNIVHETGNVMYGRARGLGL